MHFQAFLIFITSLMHKNCYCFLEEGRCNNYHLENSTGICDYQKPKE